MSTSGALDMLLLAAQSGQLPLGLRGEKVLERIVEDFLFVQHLSRHELPIYGVNTLTGHRDRTPSPPNGVAQQMIIESHAIEGAGGVYSEFVSRCIGLAKIFAVKNGGVGISLELYLHMLAALGSSDFHPSIHRGQSYSSGDVIPGAHWAKQLLAWDGYIDKFGLHPGEALGLINGSFVHLGVAAAQVPALKRVQLDIALAMSSLGFISGYSARAFERNVTAEYSSASVLLDVLTQSMKRAGRLDRLIDHTPQVSVSIRSFPEILIAISAESSSLFKAINVALNSRSGNPLFCGKEKTVSSQASFLLPEVAIRQSGVIDALLFANRCLVGGLQYVVSGRVDEVAVDGAELGDELGLIQMVKELSARLEKLNITNSGRISAHGGSTSYGIEDFWTNGLLVSDSLSSCLKEVSSVALRIVTCCELLAWRFLNKGIYFEKSSISTGSLVAKVRDFEPEVELMMDRMVDLFSPSSSYRYTLQGI